MEWARQTYNDQYEAWMPWIEDNFLYYFTKDNKASYATKDQLSQAKVTGISQVDTLQDGVHNLAAGQVGQGGLLQPIGDMASKEGLNRAERGGKDDKGSYVPSAVGNAGAALGDAGKGVGSTLGDVGKGVGNAIPGFGGSK